MGQETTTAFDITCDNPDCPGNELDPQERTGWLYLTSELYGEPLKQTVFCSYGCVGTAAAAREADATAAPFGTALETAL